MLTTARVTCSSTGASVGRLAVERGAAWPPASPLAITVTAKAQMARTRVPRRLADETHAYPRLDRAIETGGLIETIPIASLAAFRPALSAAACLAREVRGAGGAADPLEENRWVG